MQERDRRKEPESGWIEVDKKVHDLVVEDTSHPEAKEIYAVLGRLRVRNKAEGYSPDTRLVLRNIGEEEKELALCSHSDREVGYCLRTHADTPEKRIRACSSQRRLNDVRDVTRFHHFEGGLCSCGDYWSLG